MANQQSFYTDNTYGGGAGGMGAQQQGYGQPVHQQQYNNYTQDQGAAGAGYYQGQQHWNQPQDNWNQSQATAAGYDMPSTGAPYNDQSQSYNQGMYSSDVMDVDSSPPGTMGQMASAPGADDSGGYGFEDEPPLLEELGIDFALIKENTLSVLNPLKPADAGSISTTDLAGPLVFCLLFGIILLMTGKVHFGYIYGVGLLGCTSLYVVLNLMSAGGVSIGCVVSVLGYCLLPMVILSLLSVIISLNGIIGMPLALMFVCWCSYSASKLFVSVLSMQSMQLLVAYPCALIYGVFALLTVF